MRWHSTFGWGSSPPAPSVDPHLAFELKPESIVWEGAEKRQTMKQDSWEVDWKKEIVDNQSVWAEIPAKLLCCVRSERTQMAPLYDQMEQNQFDFDRCGSYFV